MGLNFFETNWSPSLPHRIYLVPIRFKAFQVFLFFYTASYVWLSGSLERGREESCKEKCQINYAVAAETSLVRILSIHQLLTSGNAKPTESSLARPFLSRLQMSAVDILSNVDKYQLPDILSVRQIYKRTSFQRTTKMLTNQCHWQQRAL